MERPGERNDEGELGYRNVDEEADHDERGSQGTAPGEPPPDEQQRGDEPDGVAGGG